MERELTAVVVAVVLYLIKLAADREQDQLLAGIASRVVQIACRLLPRACRADRLAEYQDHLAEYQRAHDAPGVLFSLSCLWGSVKEAPSEWAETAKIRFAAVLVALGIAYLQLAIRHDADPTLSLQSWQHVWPTDYAGPIWVSVDAPDDATRRVVIQWGSWERQILHAGQEAVTYVFTKREGPAGEVPVPLNVDVSESGAVVTFGSGSPSGPAYDISDSWTPLRSGT